MKPRRRRSAHASLIAFAVLALSAPPLLAQTRVADDAKRTVAVPAHVSRVFAAGAPAEVLLYTLVPEMLVGRNHMPSAAALELMPQALLAEADQESARPRRSALRRRAAPIEARGLHRLRHDRRRLRRGARGDQQPHEGSRADLRRAPHRDPDDVPPPRHSARRAGPRRDSQPKRSACSTSTATRRRRCACISRARATL